MAKYGMVIDLSRCIGCRACVEACKVENNTPAGSLWMYVYRFEDGEYPNTQVWFMPRPCQHCDNAPCVKVCPVGARYKRADGIVSTDWERCIGCRYCQVACPYSANHFNWTEPSQNYYLDWRAGPVPPYRNPDLDKSYGREKRKIAGGGRKKGVIEKCTWCVHRVEQGMDPACVANCPQSALHFGDLDDPQSNISRILKNNPSFHLLEEASTEPRVYYIGGRPPRAETGQIEAVKVRF